MNDQYVITRHDTGDNLIHIDIKLNDDGCLTVSDWCCGTAPQKFYGHDDTESYVTLGPGAVRTMYKALTGIDSGNPAHDLAVLLQSTKAGETRVQSWLRDKCDQFEIQYDWDLWP